MDEENSTTTEQPIGTKEIDEALQTLLQYKRDKQALTDRIVNAEAVSYTHLDVYKRQVVVCERVEIKDVEVLNGKYNSSRS